MKATICETGVEYPSWSRALRQPVATFAQQSVGENHDAPHDSGYGHLLCLSRVEEPLIRLMKVIITVLTAYADVVLA